MKTKFFFIVLIVLFTILSCSKSSTDPEDPIALDQQAIRGIIGDEYMSLLGDPSHFGPEDTLTGEFQSFAAILTVFWYRLPVSGLDRNYAISFNTTRDTAFVTITFSADGILRLFYYDTAAQYDSLDKNFRDDFIRDAVFARFGSSSNPYRGWKLIGLSPGRLMTPDANLQIDSALVETDDTSYYFTNSDLTSVQYIDTALFNLRELEPGDTIIVKIFSSGDTAAAFVHLSWGTFQRRVRLNPDTTDVYSFIRRIVLPDSMPERFNFSLDIINKLTFYDDAAPYFSTANIIPFKNDSD